MTILLNKFSNSLAIFSLALIICSTIEYLSSYVMEKLFNARWWDYSKKPFNINGRICLKNALCFGVMGLIH
jgi:predicted membrane protein